MRKKARGVQVRWLGAFRRHTKRGLTGMIKSARWELSASARGIERAWALSPAKGFRPVGGARIGLLVDPATSRIKKIAVGDGYSFSKDGKVVASEEWKANVRFRPPSASTPIGGAELDRPWQHYDEVTGVPTLVGVVVHPGANKRQRQMAKQLASALGIPYVGSTKDAEKFLRERRQKM